MPSKSPMSAKRRSARLRDYRAEYQRRITKSLAAGKSRSAGRGHPRAIDLPRCQPGPVDRQSSVEKALARMKRGESQAASAKAEGVSVEKLRRYRLQNTASTEKAGHWVIFDSRPQAFKIATRGAMRTVVLPNDEGSAVGRYWAAVQAFLVSNDADHLEPYDGEGVRDVRGRFWPWEVRPNMLRRLDSVGELDFTEIYADTAGTV